MATVTPELLRTWQQDILAFAASCELRRPDGTVGPPVFSARQKTWLRAVGARAPTGRPRFPTVGVVAPKRSGKSLVSAVALLHASLGQDKLSVCLSNSRESAQSLGFAVACKIMERHPLSEVAVIERNRITFPDLGTEVRVVPCSGKTVAGMGITGLLVSDELWAADDFEPWHLLTSQAETGQVLMVSQASGRSSPVFALWELAQEGTEPGLWFDYVEPAWCREHRSPNPYVSAAFLEQKRKELPAPVFAHYFENEWASGAGTFLPAETVASVFRSYALPWGLLDAQAVLDRVGPPRGAWTYGLGIDRAQPWSKTRERTGVVLVAARRPVRDDETEPVFVLLGCEVCETSSRPEVLAAVGKLKGLCPRAPVVHVEAYQGGDLAAELRAQLVTPTSQLQQELFGRLARTANAGTLHLAEEAGRGALRQELAELECDTSSKLVKFGHPAGGTDDLVYALVHAMAAADPGMAEPGEMFVIRGQGAPRRY